MKKIIGSVLLTMCFYMAFPQAVPKLNDLYIPSSPGLILGDKAPLSIEKPGTPRALGFSLLNLVEGGAVEVAPYWLSDRSGDNIEDWLNKSFTALETFSLSLASYKEDGSYGIAPGIRSKVFRKYLGGKSVHQVVADMENSLGEDVVDEQKIQKLLDKYYHASELSVDIAASMLATTDNYSFKDLNASKYAAWMNVSYSFPERIPLTATAMARYTSSLSRSSLVKDTSFLDAGLSLNYINSRFSLSGEYVYRRDLQHQLNYSRLALACNYEVFENLFIVGSFGKNFTEVKNIIAVLGLNVGLSRKRASLSANANEE